MTFAEFLKAMGKGRAIYITGPGMQKAVVSLL
jgi:hypothetical protein